MMLGRDRVIAALDFKTPDRVPRDLWSLSGVRHDRADEIEAVLKEFPMDITYAAATYPPSSRGLPDYPQPGPYTDHWGSVWFVGEPGVIGEVKQPAISDWRQLANFKPPWERLRNRSFERVKQTYSTTHSFVLSELAAHPFERLQFLRGTEDLYIDLAYGVNEVQTLIEIVHEYNLENIRQWSKADVDGILLSDDWGSNHNLLINPQMWRQLFKPLYQDYVDLIHAGGKYAFFHSDGQISSIYGDLVEIGIDAINSQLFVMDIEELGHLYQGQITFWGEIDRQHVLPFGSPEEVKDAVMRVHRALWSEAGGCIAQLEWGILDPIENIRTAYQTWENLESQIT